MFHEFGQVLIGNKHIVPSSWIVQNGYTSLATHGIDAMYIKTGVVIGGSVIVDDLSPQETAQVLNFSP